MIDFAQIMPYLMAANIVTNLGVGFYAHLVSKNKATDDRVADLEAQIAADKQAHAERISRLEVICEKAPTHADLAAVYEKLNRVVESSSRMEGQLGGVADTLRLILNRIAERGMP